MMNNETLKKLVLDAIADLKGSDVRAIDVVGKTIITDTLIIASGTSTRHTKAIAEAAAQAAKDAGQQPLGIEGDKTPEWILVDLGDIVVHVMTPETREYYNLEKLWADGEVADPSADAENA